MFIPPSRPKATTAEVRELIRAQLLDGGCPDIDAVNVDRLFAECPVMIVADRGYYLRSMGDPEKNDFGMFDDAAWIVTPAFTCPFNWNVDPSAAGWNAGLGKPYANLMAGLWPFIRGKHKGQYDALRQPYEEQAHKLKLGRFFEDGRANGWFKVLRSVPEREIQFVDEGYHAINIHKGSEYGTSSWGCQTNPPRQWPSFQRQVYELMDTHKQSWLPYLLTERAFLN